MLLFWHPFRPPQGGPWVPFGAPLASQKASQSEKCPLCKISTSLKRELHFGGSGVLEHVPLTLPGAAWRRRVFSSQKTSQKGPPRLPKRPPISSQKQIKNQLETNALLFLKKKLLFSPSGPQILKNPSSHIPAASRRYPPTQSHLPPPGAPWGSFGAPVGPSGTFKAPSQNHSIFGFNFEAILAPLWLPKMGSQRIPKRQKGMKNTAQA